MATICFGPPPLPPNKKSLNFSRNRKHSQNALLSSTYLSFRDPAEENEIVVVASEEVELTERKKTNDKKEEGRRCRRVSHTNSLSRSKDPKSPLTRSHSDGNLDKKRNNAPMTINKYIKVLSGSWKNLLNRK